MTQATPNPARDTRPTVAGFVLPWDMAVPNDTGFLDVIDAEGAQVAIVDGSDSFVLGLITDVNAQGARIAALESALVELAAIANAMGRRLGDYREARKAKAILDRLGLAHRLQGNPTQAEQVTS